MSNVGDTWKPTITNGKLQRPIVPHDHDKIKEKTTLEIINIGNELAKHPDLDIGALVDADGNKEVNLSDFKPESIAKKAEELRTQYGEDLASKYETFMVAFAHIISITFELGDKLISEVEGSDKRQLNDELLGKLFGVVFRVEPSEVGEVLESLFDTNKQNNDNIRGFDDYISGQIETKFIYDDNFAVRFEAPLEQKIKDRLANWRELLKTAVIDLGINDSAEIVKHYFSKKGKFQKKVREIDEYELTIQRNPEFQRFIREVYESEAKSAEKQ